MLIISAELRPEKYFAGEAQKQLRTTDRPLVREGSPHHQQSRNCPKTIKGSRIKIGGRSQMGAWHQDRGRLTVGHNITFTLTVSDLKAPRALRDWNMVICSVGFWIKNHCAGEDQQQFSSHLVFKEEFHHIQDQQGVKNHESHRTRNQEWLCWRRQRLANSKSLQIYNLFVSITLNPSETLKASQNSPRKDL
jgi:hypothetical protein